MPARNKTLLQDFEQALQRLEEALAQEKNDFMRDSSIKRFELVFDLAWKSVKVFLEEYHGIHCASPRLCFKEAYTQKLVIYDEFWIDVIKMRNDTVHAYNEQLSDKIYKQLPKALKYFKQLLKSLQSTTEKT